MRPSSGVPVWQWILIGIVSVLFAGFAGCVTCARMIGPDKVSRADRANVEVACASIAGVDIAGSRAATEELDRKVCRAWYLGGACKDWYTRVSGVCKKGTGYRVLANTTSFERTAREDICDGLRYELSMTAPLSVECGPSSGGGYCETKCGRPTPR